MSCCMAIENMVISPRQLNATTKATYCKLVHVDHFGQYKYFTQKFAAKVVKTELN